MNDRAAMPTAELDRQSAARRRTYLLERLRAEMPGFRIGAWVAASPAFTRSALSYVNSEFEFHNASVREQTPLERRIATRVEFATQRKAACVRLRMGGLTVWLDLQDDFAPSNGKLNGRFIWRLIPESAVRSCRLRWSLPGVPGDE